MRYLLLTLSALWLLARATAHAVRKRSGRVRRYAEPGPARPSVVTGPIPIVRPRRTGERALNPALAEAIALRRRALGMPDPDRPGPSLPPRPTAAAIAACHRNRLRHAEEQHPVADLQAHRLRSRADRDRLGIDALVDIARQVEERGEVAA